MGIAPLGTAGQLAWNPTPGPDGGDATNPLDVAQIAVGSGAAPLDQSVSFSGAAPLGQALPGDTLSSGGAAFGMSMLPDAIGSFASLFSMSRITKGLGSLIVDLTNRFQSLARDLGTQLSSLMSGAGQSQPRAIEGAAAGRGRSTPNPYDGLIRKAAQRYDLDPALLTAVARRESGFDPTAVSSAGAQGIMQLMPDTARTLGVTDVFDPAQNVDGGAKLLRGLIDQFGGHLDLALAAYNAGPGAVQKYNGVPPYKETQAYVRDILAEYRTRALTG